MSRRNHRLPHIWHLLPIWMSLGFVYFLSHSVFGPLTIDRLMSTMWVYPPFTLCLVSLTASIALCASGGAWTAAAMRGHLEGDARTLFGLLNLAQLSLIVLAIWISSTVPMITEFNVESCRPLPDVERVLAESIAADVGSIIYEQDAGGGGASLFVGHQHQWMTIEMSPPSDQMVRCAHYARLEIQGALEPAVEEFVRHRLDTRNAAIIPASLK